MPSNSNIIAATGSMKSRINTANPKKMYKRVVLGILCRDFLLKKEVKRLKDCNIKWVNDPAAPQVYVTVTPNGKKSKVTYSVRTANNVIVPETSFGYDATSPLVADAGINLAYRLFKIGESPVGEK